MATADLPRSDPTATVGWNDEALTHLHLLLRLRWLAVAGQIAAIALALLVYHAPLPVADLLAMVGLTIATNAAVALLQPRLDKYAKWVVFGLLLLDTGVLTAMLLMSGGLHNPFTSFYLLHITLAAVLMPRAEAAILGGVCFLCAGLIYGLPIPGPASHADHAPHSHATRAPGHWISMEMHFDGMMITLLATGTAILLFVGRLQRELKTRNEVLAANQERLQRQQRVVGLATLAAGVAHELATPLSTIAVVSQDLKVMAGKFCSNQSCVADSALIRREVDRCRAIIDRLTARGAVPESALVELDAATLRESLAEFLPAACAGRLVLGGDPTVTVFVDRTGLLQSLAALVKNGCEADPAGRPVLLRMTRVANRCRFEVTDQGAGIPTDVRARLGDPFVTTKEAGRGLGLGLHLVQLACLLHDGDLRVGQTSSAGTTMILEFPSGGAC